MYNFSEFKGYLIHYFYQLLIFNIKYLRIEIKK